MDELGVCLNQKEVEDRDLKELLNFSAKYDEKSAVAAFDEYKTNSIQKANTLTFKLQKIYHLRSNQLQARRQIGHSNIEITQPKFAQDKVDPNKYETINYMDKDENKI